MVEERELLLGAGSVAVAMVLLGRVGVDVHDFALFVFGYSAWALVIGVQLIRRAPDSPP